MNRIFAIGILVGVTLAWCATSGAVAQNGAWGDVKGTIIWGGDKIPERLPLDLKENPDRAVCAKDGKLLDETWVVHPKNKGLRYTFVWLVPKDKEAKLPIHPSLNQIKQKKVIIDQPICTFIPHAIGMREGQVLVAKNSANLSHNFKWSGHPDVNPGGNVLLPPNSEKVIDDLKADRFPISIECNIHPWMKGWVRVFNHPYYAVTDADGKFELTNAPAGEWQLMVWHAQGYLGGAKGRNGQRITIKGGSITDLGKLVYQPPSN